MLTMKSNLSEDSSDSSLRVCSTWFFLTILAFSSTLMAWKLPSYLSLARITRPYDPVPSVRTSSKSVSAFRWMFCTAGQLL